ncbi:MAG: DinB family protein, partial [Candidatus Rokuibacteriota bacterium]
FSDAMNDKWWPALGKAPTDFLTAKVDFSFMTPLGLLTHIANIENGWMDVVEDSKANWARHSTKEWTELAPVEAYTKEARARTHRLVDVLDDAGLQRACPVEPGVFAKDAFTVEELLFTVFTHEQWHRGELLAALWSRNIEPPPLDWPRYATALSSVAADFPV